MTKRTRGSTAFSGASQCKGLIKVLIKHKYAWPFVQPVDPIALGIPDYFDVIKKPMDFSTITNKLESGEYKSVDGFEADVQLVFNNCSSYNLPGSSVVKMSDSLRATFESKFQSIKESVEAEGEP